MGEFTWLVGSYEQSIGFNLNNHEEAAKTIIFLCSQLRAHVWNSIQSRLET